MIVTIDGPAGSGKSSTARAVARRLGIQFLDSGALYRAATLVYLRSDEDENTFFEQLKKSTISFYFQEEVFHISLDGEDITDRIRSMEVSEHVSQIASMKSVRSYVNELMRTAVRSDIYVADGRDLGTAVFPDADLKFFMVADLNTRAQRRYEELSKAGHQADLNKIRENIAERDRRDSGRSEDPLRKPQDATEIDTSELDFEEQVTIISDKIRELIKQQ